MIELVFTACVAVQIDRCQTQTQLFQDISMMTCMVHAQTQLAEWSEAHPGWQITEWLCRWHQRSGAEI